MNPEKELLWDLWVGRTGRFAPLQKLQVPSHVRSKLEGKEDTHNAASGACRG